MKTKLYPFLFFFALLSSCTLSGGGFYSGLKYAKVNSQKSTSTASKKENQEKQEQTFTDDHTDHSISAGETIDLATTSKLKNPAKQAGKTIANTPNKKSLPKDSCDLIYTKKGEEIYGILKEVGLTTLSYKSCDNLNGPLYVINRDEVVYIAYKNGEKEIIQTDKVYAPAPTPASTPDKAYDGTRGRNYSDVGLILSIFSIPFTIFTLVSTFSSTLFLPILFLITLLLSVLGIVFTVLEMSNKMNAETNQRDFSRQIVSLSIDGLVLLFLITLLFVL